MSVVAAPNVPMYQQGWAPPTRAPHFGHLCVAPKTPLHLMGASDWARYSEIVLSKPGDRRFEIALRPHLGLAPYNLIGPAVVSPSGGTASSALLSAGSGAAQGFAMGGPIGAGIGAIAGAIAGIWASHDARVAGATAENKVVQSALTAWDASMQAIFAAANSSDPSKNISGAQAAQTVQQVYQQWWTAVCPHTKGPGAADTSGCGQNCGSTSLNPSGPCAGTPGGHKCDKSCTASCCVGCQDLYPSMLQAVAVLNNPSGGSVQVCGVAGSKYGVSARSGYTLTYTPPTVTSTASSAASSAASAISSLFGGSPSTPGAPSSTNWLLLAGLALGGFMLARAL